MVGNMAHMPYNEKRVNEKNEVQFYEKENGECPVELFLLGTDLKMRAKAWIWF